MGLIDKIKKFFGPEHEEPKAYDGVHAPKSIPVGLDPSKECCGTCGIYYDSSNSSCPFCHGDPEIEEIMRSYH